MAIITLQTIKILGENAQSHVYSDGTENMFMIDPEVNKDWFSPVVTREQLNASRKACPNDTFTVVTL